ncbi:helix-turn-helix domain-containing protein [Candidatus Pacearchaeota archaeon]|nr:helix-turn-helix domain-containing protein [Candidatus Pacearchaeota archaeon]
MILKPETGKEKIEKYFDQSEQLFYSTGDIAKLCKVAPKTVSRWIDEGYLRGYKIPGSKERRVSPKHLKRFLCDHEMAEVLEEEEFFWTGEVAAICRISIQSIIHGYNLGVWKGHSLPGSKFRRIGRGTLEKVMKEYDIPREYLDSYQQKYPV